MTTGCKRLLLERYAGGELDESERTAVLNHLAECPGCSSYVARIEAERVAFLKKYPFSSFTRAHAPAVPVPWYRRLPALLL